MSLIVTLLLGVTMAHKLNPKYAQAQKRPNGSHKIVCLARLASKESWLLIKQILICLSLYGGV